MAKTSLLATMFMGVLLGVTTGPCRSSTERTPTITVLPDLPTFDTTHYGLDKKDT